MNAREQFLRVFPEGEVMAESEEVISVLGHPSWPHEIEYRPQRAALVLDQFADGYADSARRDATVCEALETARIHINRRKQ